MIALHSAGARFNPMKTLPDVLDRVAQLAHGAFPFVTDNARQALYELFQQSQFVHHRLDPRLERTQDQMIMKDINFSKQVG